MIHEPFDETISTRRRTAPKAARRRIIGTREILLVVLAFALLAIVPSVAQNDLFTRPATSKVQTALLAPEIPGENFPGSAFYYLDTASIKAPAAMSAGLGHDTLALTDDNLGNAARPFIMTAGTTDHARALKCLTDAIYYEAANEPDAGQQAVAQVILNRMRHPSYPHNVCGVVYQGSERTTGCQFSYSCDGSMARVPARPAWLRAQRVAAQALAGFVYTPVGMATHYHATYVYPYWAPSLNYISTIGAHRFYSWKGAAGRPSAFFRSYAGNEPFPGPKARVWTPSLTPVLDPIQLQQQYDREFAAARLKAEAEARTASAATVADYTARGGQRPAPVFAAPDYSAEARTRGGETAFAGERLPASTGIKAEFQNSGSWKKQPSG